jgi:membrane protein DedA with SNARE-associated domain
MEYLYVLILQYKYFVLLPIAVVEGPIATVIASFLASQGFLNIYIVYIIAIVGNLIGDSIYYSIGRLGRYTFIAKHGHYIGITEDRVRSTEEYYKNHLLKTILISKMVNAGIEVFLVTAGIARVNFKKFIGGILLIEIPKNILIVAVGYYFGKSYILIGKYLDNYFKIVFAVLCASVLSFVAYRFYLKRKID